MILLFRDGSYKVLDADTPEGKFIAKVRKEENRLVAVAFEAFNRLGSDLFTIILAENLRTSIDPFEIQLVTCVVGDDEGPHDGNIMVRHMKIEGIFQLYSLSTLIYQMLKNYDISSALNMVRGIVILKIVITTFDGKIYEIEPGADSTTNDIVTDWLKQFGIRCDTDEFLYKKSTRSKDDCVVTMRYSASDGEVRPAYYWPQERRHLILSGERWIRVSEPLDFDLLLKLSGFMTTIACSGICIPNTGLMYLCPIAIGVEIFTCDSMEVIYSVNNRNDHTIYISNDLMACDGVDYLYMALYLPQMLDAGRFLYQEDPIKIDIEMVREKFLARRGRYDIKVPKQIDEGIEFDMLGMLANIVMNEPISDIRIENHVKQLEESKLAQLIPPEDQ